MNCPSCGALVSARPDQTQWQCPFCSTSVVVAPELAPALPPPVTARWIVTLLAGMGGAAFLFVVSRRLGAQSWSGTEPLDCAGNDEIRVSDITASFSAGSAVTIAGNCHAVFENVSLRAPVAIDVSGNGHVVFEGGSIDGSAWSVAASGNAEVELRGTRVIGEVSTSGNAKVRR